MTPADILKAYRGKFPGATNAQVFRQLIADAKESLEIPNVKTGLKRTPAFSDVLTVSSQFEDLCQFKPSKVEEYAKQALELTIKTLCKFATPLRAIKADAVREARELRDRQKQEAEAKLKEARSRKAAAKREREAA